MPNIKGEYIVPVYTWTDDQTAIDKGYAELIRCKDCRYFKGKWCNRDTIQVIADEKDRILMKYAWVSENDYCSRAERRGEE